MNTAYFDCFSGASGDMILGAMVDAGLSIESLREALAALPLKGFRLDAEKVKRAGLGGTRVHVLTEAPSTHDDNASSSDHAPGAQGNGHRHHLPHRHLPDIVDLIQTSGLHHEVKSRACAVFRRLGEAEAAVHGIPLDRVHFHEVGAVDAIVDITGACAGLHLLGVEAVFVSTFRVGSGQVKCAHGILPLPSPATVELVKGFPVEPAGVTGELLTPTGAAILTTLAERSPLPAMTITRTGYGAGRADRSRRPNLLRLCIGEAVRGANTPAPSDERDEVFVIQTNLDDMSPEWVGYLFDRLFEAGAVDVFTTPVQMKKSRPGIVLTTLAPEEAVPRIEEALFDETTTFGVRKHRVERRKLAREIRRVHTRYGDVRVKIGRLAGQVKSAAPEYEDCRALAEKHRVPLRAMYDAAAAAARAEEWADEQGA